MRRRLIHLYVASSCFIDSFTVVLLLAFAVVAFASMAAAHLAMLASAHWLPLLLLVQACFAQGTFVAISGAQ